MHGCSPAPFHQFSLFIIKSLVSRSGLKSCNLCMVWVKLWHVLSIIIIALKTHQVPDTQKECDAFHYHPSPLTFPHASDHHNVQSHLLGSFLGPWHLTKREPRTSAARSLWDKAARSLTSLSTMTQQPPPSTTDACHSSIRHHR